MIIEDQEGVHVDEEFTGSFDFESMDHNFSEYENYALLLYKVNNAVVNVSASNHGAAVRLEQCSNVVVTVESYKCATAVTVAQSQDIEILNGKWIYSAKAHIHGPRNTGLHIHDNFGVYGCCNESTGGIYLGQTRDSLVERNHIANNQYGNYWNWDGGAIYLERESENNTVRENLITGSYLALQDNSGSSNLWELNTLVDCNNAMDITDGRDIVKGVPEYRTNLLIRTPDIGPRTKATHRQTVIC